MEYRTYVETEPGGSWVSRREMENVPDETVWRYLYNSLPSSISHRWGGDWDEFRDGVCACAARGDVGKSRDGDESAADPPLMTVSERALASMPRRMRMQIYAAMAHAALAAGDEQRAQAAGIELASGVGGAPLRTVNRRNPLHAFLLRMWKRVRAKPSPPTSTAVRRFAVDEYIAMEHGEQEAAMWRMAHGETDPALDDRLRAAGITPATRSIDRPRTLAKLRPGWVVLLMRLLGRDRE
jgi:hypothetical protein